MTKEEWEELEKYANLCSDSYGSAVELICELYNRNDYISDELKKTLIKESKWNLNNFKKNTEITIRKETRTEQWEELDWI